jgi:L-ornithine Nalpha-acyltransferase
MIIAPPRYRSHLAQTAADRDAVAALRHAAFFGGSGLDCDIWDDISDHVMITDVETGALACTFRIAHLTDQGGVDRSYTGQRYDLTGFYGCNVLELGRFCTARGELDSDVLRLAWAQLTAVVAAKGVQTVIGCSSFKGADPAAHAQAFQLLFDRHMGPEDRRPSPKSTETVALDTQASVCTKQATRSLPELLRSYLRMGGWVGDHAVIDREVDTMHVFTALDVAQIPAGRLRTLHQLAQSCA